MQLIVYEGGIMLSKLEVAKNLRKFSENNFNSFAELARRMNISPQTIQAYIDGRVYPGGPFLAKLSDLGCDINWLLTGKVSTDMKYVPIEEAEKVRMLHIPQFPIAGVVPAGKAEIFEYNDWYEFEPIDFQKDRYVFLKIDENNGYSMMPMIEPGDLVLIDLNDKPKDGDVVAARWDETGGAVKILSINEDNPKMIALMSYNQSVKPIFKDIDMVALYRVVMIKKKMK